MAQPATAVAYQGLGFGDLGMPTSDSLPAGALLSDDRYSAFKTSGSSGEGGAPSSHPFGHSLVSKSAKTANNPDQAAGPASATTAPHNNSPSRKHSVVSLTDHRESISYPKPWIHHQDADEMLFNPSMPAPAPPASDVIEDEHATSRVPLPASKATKSRPSPIKVPSTSTQTSGHAHALGPLLQRPFMQRLANAKDKECSPNKSRTNRMGSVPEDEHHVWLESQTITDSKDAVEISMAKAKEFQEAFEARVRKDSGYGGSISGPTPAVLPVLPPPPLQTDGSDVSSPNLSPRAKPTSVAAHKISTRPKAAHQHHRRATSEDSPKILQEATFRSFADVDLDSTAYDPATISFATRERLQTASPTLTSPTRAHHELPARFRHSRSHSTTAIHSRKNSSIPMDAFLRSSQTTTDVTPIHSPTRQYGLSASSSRRPSVAPKPFDASNSIAVSVKSHGRNVREVARAPIQGAEPITVLLQTHLRPEEIEASWTCTVALDAQGRPCTQWALTLKPKAAWAEAPTASESEHAGQPAAHFSGYSLGGPHRQTTPIKHDRPAAAPETSPMSEVPTRIPSQPVPLGPTSSRRPSAFEHAPFDPNAASSHVDPLYVPGTPQRPRIESRDTIKAGEQRQLLANGRHSPNRPRRKLGSDSSEDADAQLTPRRPSASKASAQHRHNVTSPVRSAYKLGHDGSRADREDEPRTPTRPIKPPMVGVTPPTPFVGVEAENSDAAVPPIPDFRTVLSGVHEDSDDTVSDLDVDESRRAAELALARGKQRMMSKWSDTEGEETEDDDDRPKTSWSSVSDGTDDGSRQA
ncbi:hypothetical protein OIV83_004697 [Microbotryomycetes sp. JL201]|nr:hypothetical protein OIV83_004697 [Microbotryomycetes sp. JL201]